MEPDRIPLEPGARVAVVGAGLAGLACARRLADAGRPVRVFDKARGAGGRICTRREGPWVHDHGAQFFRARDPDFVRRVSHWEEAGVVARWTASASGQDGVSETEPRFVGTPGMSALGRHLAAGLAVQTSCRVESLTHRAQGGWGLRDDFGRRLGDFSALVLALPAPQAHTLLAGLPGREPCVEPLLPRLEEVVLEPCWAVLLGFERPLPVAFAQRRWSQGPLAWAARNTSKPGRGPSECWVLHGAPGWSREHLEWKPEPVAEALFGAFQAVCGQPLPQPVHVDGHRWRHALASRPLGEPFLWQEDLCLGLCGDWCLGARVEAAWQSGHALGEALVGPESPA